MQTARPAAQQPTLSAPAEERADELLLLACRRFCGEDGYDKLRPDQLRTAFYQLIDAVDDHCKREMADMLADRPDTPRPIAHYLSLEPVHVGGEMLLRSPVLGQLDLMRIAHTGGAEHGALIANRSDLGTALKRQLGVEPQAVESPSAREKLLAAAARKTTLTPAKSAKTEPFARRLEMAAWRNERGNMEVLLARELGVQRSASAMIMADESADILAVALKSLDIEAAQAHRIAMYAFPQIGLDVSNSLRAMAFYDRLTVQGCQQAVAQWPAVDATEPENRRRADDGIRTIGGQQAHRIEERVTFGRRKRAV